MIRLSGEIDLIVNIIVVNIIITYYAQARRNTHTSFEYRRSSVFLRLSADNFFRANGAQRVVYKKQLGVCHCGYGGIDML